MVLSDLTLSSNTTAESIKEAVENKLRTYLPEGSFTVILRTYQGDFRTRQSSSASYQAMILLDKNGKQAALNQKAALEQEGFRVSPNGDIKVSLN